MSLSPYGWNPLLEDRFAPFRAEGLEPARVVCEMRDGFRVATEPGELEARLSGRFRHEAVRRTDAPAVGDWVAIRPLPGEPRAVIHALLPRTSRFSRKVAWRDVEEQVVAANIDTVFLVSGLDRDFNPRRIERYLTLAWDSGAAPVVVLNKADLCPDPEPFVAQAEILAAGVPTHPVSALQGTGLDALEPYLGEGRTVALVGSSGVGKSALINRLLGEERLKTRPVRADDQRGRHTTTHRELIPLPSGGVVIDTPGMRELQLWADEGDLDRSFSDIEEIARDCRFRDCSHEREPGCAVHLALGEGALEAARFESFLRLRKELRSLARRRARKERQARRRRNRRKPMPAGRSATRPELPRRGIP